MRRSHLASLTLPIACVTACFAAPRLDADLGESSGIALDEGDEDPYLPGSSDDGAGVSSEPTPPSDDETSDSGAPASDDDGATPADESSDGESDSGSAGAGFPAPGLFGDDVRELDLVGTWTFPWVPTGVPDVMITIADDGAFTWRETEADCSDAGSASGQLWLEGAQLVLHLDAWDKKEPWDVEDVLGEPLARPFRLRLGYAPMGGFLGFAARKQLTDVVQWRGAGYLRLEAGEGPTGAWVSEAELWAIPAGESEAQLLVRDRFFASLITGGAVRIDHASTWWWPAQGPEELDESISWWVDETPGWIAGAATIDGESFAYDAEHLMAFAPDRTFQHGVVSDCP